MTTNKPQDHQQGHPTTPPVPLRISDPDRFDALTRRYLSWGDLRRINMTKFRANMNELQRALIHAHLPNMTQADAERAKKTLSWLITETSA